MATQIKTVLFFLCVLMVLRAPPALSVPLSSGIDQPGSTADGPDFVLASDDATQTLDGTTEETNSRARIVDNQEVAGGSSHTPGWLLPAAAVGVGGGTLFALLSHGGKQTSNGGADASGLDVIAGGTPGVSVGLGHGGNGGETPSAVPEPGTLLMLGIGAASFLGRRNFMKA